MNGRMTYPETAVHPTDSQFDEMVDEEHHTGSSPLKELGVGLVTSFVLDYMHLVCLGVVRKLIFLWLKGPFKCRISADNLTVISQYMTSVKLHFPRSFSRKPRSLFEFRMWKATEFRLFLLYAGPVVLRNNLPSNVCRNFMLLSVAMRILLSPNLCSEFCEYAGDLLKVFVENFKTIYGPEFVVYNVHCLIHIAQDAQRFGPLGNISCFPYENFLGKIRNMVRRPQYPIQQVVRRVYEKQRVKLDAQAEKSAGQQRKLHFFGPLPKGFETYGQYKQYYWGNMLISDASGDNCFDVNGQIALVRNILHSSDRDTHVVCELFEKKETFYDYPLDSSALGISVVYRLSGHLQVIPVTEFTKKVILLPYNGAFVALPLLHDC